MVILDLVFILVLFLGFVLGYPGIIALLDATELMVLMVDCGSVVMQLV